MPKFPKNTGFRMKGYSYPGESPNKQLGGRYSHLTLRSNSSSPKNEKQDKKEKTDPNIDKYKSGWDMDWGKALKTLLSSGLSKKGIMKALGQGLKVPSKKSQNEQRRMTVEDYLKRMEESS